MQNRNDIKRTQQSGFSLIELLVVMAIIVTMSAVSIYYFTGQRKLYNTDEQSLHIIDLMQEARQRSLTQRVVIRVEIDLTSNIGRLINENDPTKVTDDKIIRQVAFYKTSIVKMDTRPTNVTVAPPETLPAPIAVYRGSLHPLSAGHNVATFRFLRNGTVVDAGSNALGANAVVTGSTLYIWKPKTGNTNQSDLTKAISIIGATGSVRMWDLAVRSDGNTYWKDSRRAGYSGGTATGSPAR